MAVGLILLAGIGYGASFILTHLGTPAPTPTPSPAPAVSSTERSKVSDKPLSSSQLDVTDLTAQTADIGTLLVKALQVSSNIALQGSLTVTSDGTFGGTVRAANFVGSGAGLTGINATQLGGQAASFYQQLGNLQGTLSDAQLSANVALRNAPNTFTATNTFNANASFNGTTTVANLVLGSPLGAGQGGTGLATPPNQGVLYGSGGNVLNTAVPAGAGLCLISTATDLQWASCSGGGGGVVSLNGLTNILTLANATGSGSTITINDASTAQKGIAQFNATNFSAASGIINTIQNIAVTSAPTFAGLTVTGPITASGVITANGGILFPGDNFLQLTSSNKFSDTTGIILPLYIYPANVATNTDYNNLIALKKKYHDVPLAVVLDPANGPGVSTDVNYAAAIKRLHGAGITVLGYVDTNFAAVAQNTVETNIDTWDSLYTGIDGTFLDNMSADNNAGHFSYYAAITAYAHGKSHYPVVANAGTQPDSGYFDNKAADIYNVFENSFFPSEAILQGDFFGGNADYQYRQRSVLVYKQATLDYAQLTMMRKYTGAVYVTSGDLPNPWGTLPSYLENIFQALSTPNDILLDTVTAGTSITAPTVTTNAISPTGALTVGATNQTLTLQGSTTTLSATSSGVTNTLAFATPTVTGKTITIPNETGTICTTGSICAGYAANSGNGNYIQNQIAGDQTADFRISGTGRAGNSLLAPLIDTATATALALGTTNATAINLNQNTTIAAAKTLTVTSALTSLTSATTGDALSVSNSTSTGNIAVFKDNATAVLTVGDGGATTLQNETNQLGALKILTTTASGSHTLFNADTINERIGIGGVATASKLEIQGGNAAIYNSGADPKLIIGDGTGAGQNGFLMWDSTNDYLRLETTGTNGLKVNDNFVAIGNIFPSQPLIVGNGSTLLAQINTTGEGLFRTSTDSATGFQIQNHSSVNLFAVDTSAQQITLGPAGGDTTGTILVLGNKTTIGDPTGVEGAMYYNSALKAFRCFRDSLWRYCNEPHHLAYGYNLQEDFFTDDTSADSLGTHSWNLTNAGTGAVVGKVAADLFNRPGQIQLSSGTSATGQASVFLGDTAAGREQFIIGGGEDIEFAVNVGSLGAAADDYVLRLGLCDKDTTDCSDGLYFEYDRTATTNWRMAGAVGGVRAKADSGVAVAAGSWVDFKILVNAGATQADFYINGTNVGFSTNIPTGATRLTMPMFQLAKSSGATNRTLKVDYFDMSNSFTTAR
jgi:hypothetical protein